MRPLSTHTRAPASLVPWGGSDASTAVWRSPRTACPCVPCCVYSAEEPDQGPGALVEHRRRPGLLPCPVPQASHANRGEGASPLFSPQQPAEASPPIDCGTRACVRVLLTTRSAQRYTIVDMDEGEAFVNVELESTMYGGRPWTAWIASSPKSLSTAEAPPPSPLPTPTCAVTARSPLVPLLLNSSFLCVAWPPPPPPSPGTTRGCWTGESTSVGCTAWTASTSPTATTTRPPSSRKPSSHTTRYPITPLPPIEGCPRLPRLFSSLLVWCQRCRCRRRR